MSLNLPSGIDDIETTAITTGEVETIEALILRFAIRVSGTEPDENVWERMSPYCQKNEEKKDGWAAGNAEYFRWALLWIQKTRSYLDYLGGIQIAEGDPVTTRSINAHDAGREQVAYDVALSFAGEDRNDARRIASLLREKGFSVFYDEYEQAALWGQNLYTHLSNIYQNKAKYCLMFISSHYAAKLWTRREREAAQARAFRENREYILPLKLDDTTLPGIEETIGYIDLRKTPHEEVVQLLASKIKKA